MRTLRVCAATGGPFQYSPTRPGKTELRLEAVHRALRISSAEFDERAAELGRTLEFFKVRGGEKAEVLAAFAAHNKRSLLTTRRSDDLDLRQRSQCWRV